MISEVGATGDIFSSLAFSPLYCHNVNFMIRFMYCKQVCIMDFIYKKRFFLNHRTYF